MQAGLDVAHARNYDGNSRAWKKFLDNKIWNGRHPTGEEQLQDQ